MVAHLELDILECEVKWALGSITKNKASGDDGISVELFQILKDDAVKVLHSIGQQIWKTRQWLQDWEWSVLIPIPKEINPKECSNCCTIVFISHVCKVMLIILRARLQHGEGNGNPFQYSCLENPMDGGAWWAAVHGVVKSRTRLHFDFSLSCIGEGNGNPLQCSCLENPRDGGAWWTAIYGVTPSRTRLK